jgi:hypothetical protein
LSLKGHQQKKMFMIAGFEQELENEKKLNLSVLFSD